MFRSLILATALCLFCAPPVFAEEGADEFFEAVAERLSLTDEQRPAVESALQSHRERIKGIRSDKDAGNLRRRGAFKAFQQSREQLDAELDPVLDDAQKAEFKAARKENREARRNRR